MAFKKRTKQDIKSKKNFTWGRKTKKGTMSKDGVSVVFNDGTEVTLLTPSGKASKYAAELGMGCKITNNGEFKHDNNGNEIPLDCCSRAYRSGYLDCQKDNSKAYKAKKNNRPKKRTV